MSVEAYLSNINNEFSVLPFWFWNDDITKEEISRQLDDFEAHGVYGFTIHPRVGLPRSLGWMSEAILAFYDFAIEEAHRRHMKVVLYDEGMYPSGSSSGQVVAANPDFQVRCLDFKIFSGQTKIQLPPDHNLIATQTMADGEIFATFDRKANGYIRGLHFTVEGNDAEDEPMAADILNPKSVQKFIELVYLVFAKRYQKYLGTTIVGVFTDEPSMLGKSREKKVMPGTKDILPEINRILGYDFAPYLPCLWQEHLPEAKKKKAEYLEACEMRLLETYYAPISKFCQENNLKLMGHPAKSDDIGALRFFDIPGQDLVWRMVVPDSPTAIEGENSTMAKCSSSAMIHMNRERNLNELCGAYGHQLTWDEMNWLSKWCFIRGVNMLLPHAFYYSVRGLRKEERPPDVGPNSPWWHQYKGYADACKALSFINTKSKHVCEVAIIGKCNWLPWQSAKICFENQIDFNYLDESHFVKDVKITKEGISFAGMLYKTIIHEHVLSDAIANQLEPLSCVGRVLFYVLGKNESFLSELEKQNAKSILISPQSPDLRLRIMIKNGFTFYMLFNEASKPINISVEIKTSKPIELFKPFEKKFSEYKNQSKLAIDGFEYLVFVV
jgi:hypothetical protein